MQMPSQLILPQPMRQTIIQESRAGSPEEICGIVRGRSGRALELFAARNEAEDRAVNYLVDPQVLMKQFEFEDSGDEMVAIYHSHPESPAYPSATDAWTAQYPDAVYLICSLAASPAEVRGFLLRDVYPECNLSRLIREVEFYETRPGLFAYYQEAGVALPPALAAAGLDSVEPFYVVFLREEDPGADVEVRYVMVRETCLVED